MVALSLPQHLLPPRRPDRRHSPRQPLLLPRRRQQVALHHRPDRRLPPPLHPTFPLSPPPTTTTTPTTDLHRPPSMAKLALIYIFIGLLIAGDDLMYSYGLLYLPVSTYALICATQLAFNAVFSYFINHQKFTPLIFNSVVLLTFSAVLLGVNSDSEGSDTKPSAGKYAIGFACTLGASAAYSLILSSDAVLVRERDQEGDLRGRA
ncbi:putative purine permease 11 [Acorus calamus]|uniref:Purine permease 11 n=1 Tax=Acorus calamus TaxID=4465 RepID=A0AAV9DX99_ACOCL|nr:putative purine permease 11 [Acorus calamus]